jgi:hypothetical protein
LPDCMLDDKAKQACMDNCKCKPGDYCHPGHCTYKELPDGTCTCIADHLCILCTCATDADCSGFGPASACNQWKCDPIQGCIEAPDPAGGACSGCSNDASCGCQCQNGACVSDGKECAVGSAGCDANGKVTCDFFDNGPDDFMPPGTACPAGGSPSCPETVNAGTAPCTNRAIVCTQCIPAAKNSSCAGTNAKSGTTPQKNMPNNQCADAVPEFVCPDGSKASGSGNVYCPTCTAGVTECSGGEEMICKKEVKYVPDPKVTQCPGLTPKGNGACAGPCKAEPCTGEA